MQQVLLLCSGNPEGKNIDSKKKHQGSVEAIEKVQRAGLSHSLNPMEYQLWRHFFAQSQTVVMQQEDYVTSMLEQLHLSVYFPPKT